MTKEFTLIERLAEKLGSVARDTHYGIHDDDYCIPFGTTVTQPHQQTSCRCALCDALEYLSTRSNK